MLRAVGVAAGQVDRPRDLAQRTGIVHVRLEHAVQLCRAIAIDHPELRRALDLVVNVVGTELLANGRGDVISEVDVEP